MALTVEDGTGLANADSYVSVADATAYHAAMGNAAWAALDTDEKEWALRRATQYIDVRYNYRGSPLRSTQALAWPRTSSPWPVQAVIAATCEAALRARDGLFRDVEGGDVLSEQAGKIAVTYAPSNSSGQVRYFLVDSLLAPYTMGGSALSVRLERAS